MTKQTSEKKTRGAGGRPAIDAERRAHVGQVIRKYRTAAGMDQVTLAEKLGYTKTAIGNWELGLTRPDIDNVPKICQVLNIPVTELLDMPPETALPKVPLQVQALSDELLPGLLHLQQNSDNHDKLRYLHSYHKHSLLSETAYGHKWYYS